MSETPDIRVVSPYRPLPLAAKKALAAAVNSTHFPDDNPRVAFVNEIPPSRIVAEYELTVETGDEPTEVWKSDSGQTIRVFSDRVEMDGSEVGLPRDEIRSKLQNQDRFSLDDPTE